MEGDTLDENIVRRLKSYETACDELNRLSMRYVAQAERICEYRLSKMFPSVKADGMPHSSTVSDGMSGYICYLIEMETDLHRLGVERDKAVDRTRQAMKDVQELVKDDELLRLRFLNRLSYNDIAKHTGMSVSTVFYRIQQAIRQL